MGGPARCWRFGNAELDELRRELRVAGAPVQLEPKPFNVLLCLVRRAGEVVSKDELIRDVWAGRIVSESVIANCVNKLRQALNDEQQAVIATVHGFGYRFDARLDAPSEAPPALPVRPGGVWQHLRARRALLAAAFAAAAFALAWQVAHRPAPDPSVAVLPFENLSPLGETDAYLAAGIQENILAHLARVKGLKVISRTSVMRYRGTALSVREIGGQLDVAHVLEGSVQRDGDQVRVTAQLIDVATDRHLWSETYDRRLQDLLLIQSEIAERIARSVGLQISEKERLAIQRRATHDVGAYELYLRAREHQRADGASRDRLFEAQSLLQRAVAEDPEFALAHAALSQVHTTMYWFGYDPAPERRDQARRSAERALELDPHLAEGYLALGRYRASGFNDYDGALQAYQRALEEQPNSAELHRAIASTHRRRGQLEPAVAAMTLATELDPANPSILEDLASLHHYGLRRYRDAAPLYERIRALAPDDVIRQLIHAQFLFDWKGDLEPLRRVLAAIPEGIDPDNFVTYFRYLVAYWDGRYLDAARWLERHPAEWLSASGGGRYPKESVLGLLYASAGETERAANLYRRARVLLESELRSRPDAAREHYSLAFVLAGLGERDRALQLVQRARDLSRSLHDPIVSADLAQGIALLYLRLGEKELALAEVEKLLRAPYGPSAHSLRLPIWKGLHGDPRFEALVAAHLPRE